MSSTDKSHAEAIKFAYFSSVSPLADASAKGKIIPLPSATGYSTPRDNAASELPQLYVRRHFNRFLGFYAVTDAISLLAGFSLAWGLASLINDIFFARDLPVEMTFGSVFWVKFGVIAAGVLLWFQHTGHYRVRMPFWLEVKNIIGAMSFAMVADGFLQFAYKQDFSRLWLMSSWVFAAIAMIITRPLIRAWLRRKGLWKVPTLLVGNGPTAEDTKAALKSERGLGYEITARIKNLPLAFLQEGSSWEKLCRAYNVDYVVIALDGPELALAEQPIAQLMRESIPFSVSPPRRNLPVLDMVPQYFFNHDVKLLTRNNKLEQILPCFIKRTFDILVSCLLLAALSPFLLLIAVCVKMDGGPALFGHSRIGRHGKAFACLKFRSMAVNSKQLLEEYLAGNPAASAEWVETHKLKNDPRITRIGAFLRKTSLDELPQLLNVLMGQMSLVGPRPIVSEEANKYDSDIAYYNQVRPGITGLWQVSGRNDVSYKQRVQMDCWYVRNWSLWHDVAILCKTFPALLARRGAY